jgi:hypothetical protein
MVGMATWEDGPEYAPIARPDGFAQPSVPPLDVAQPVQQQAALAPKDRPQFTDPPAPVAPLAALVPPVETPRDPAQPFAVVSSTMTSDSAWGAAHWSPPTGPPIGAAGPWSRPSGSGQSPWTAPAPTQPLVPMSGPAENVSGFPAPGTAEWFAPPAHGQQPATGQVDARRVFEAATPGVCICLAIGGFVYLIAPIMLGVAFALASRVKVATASVRRALLTGVIVLGVLALTGVLTNNTSFTDWWAFVGMWALLICWLMLGVVLFIVYRGLKNPAQVHPNRSPWG